MTRALGVPFEEVTIQRTRGRKPFYGGGTVHSSAPNFNFNLSHEVSVRQCLQGGADTQPTDA